MKNINGFLVAAICGIFPISTLAVPLDITETGGTPEHLWDHGLGADWGLTFEDEDVIFDASGPPASINLAGVNSIQVTWNAPAGEMYVVNSASSQIGNMTLAFETTYGVMGQGTSLGSLTASSMSVNTIYGTSPLTGGATLNAPTGYNGGPALVFGAEANITPTTTPFAFNSITVTADFSGTSPSGTLDQTSIDGTSYYFGILYGGPNNLQVGTNPYGLTDPGPLLTLEPLPTGSVPEAPSTCFLAGLSFAGFWLCGRKLSAGNS